MLFHFIRLTFAHTTAVIHKIEKTRKKMNTIFTYKIYTHTNQTNTPRSRFLKIRQEEKDLLRKHTQKKRQKCIYELIYHGI